MIGTVLACEGTNLTDPDVNANGHRFTVRVVGPGWLLSVANLADPILPGARVLVAPSVPADAAEPVRLAVTEIELAKPPRVLCVNCRIRFPAAGHRYCEVCEAG